MSFQRFLAVIACALLASSSIFSTSTVDVRLSHNSLDKADKALYVNIDVRADHQDRFVLAGQNYRIFYPTATLSLNEDGSKSQLSPDHYSNLQFSSVLENVEASGQGAITFDKNLGFANFSVELLDNERGGEVVSDKDGWMTIATLKFDVIDDFDAVSMVWGRESLSADYATAFVEIAEWEAPLKTSTVIINEYIDFNLEINALSLDGIAYELTVGPNPAIDFVQLKSDKALGTDMKVVVRDLSGKLVKTQLLTRGNTVYSVDVSALQAASYIFDLSDQNGKNLMSKKVVIAR